MVLSNYCRANKHVTSLSQERKPEVNIFHARTMCLPDFKLIASKSEKILNNIKCVTEKTSPIGKHLTSGSPQWL